MSATTRMSPAMIERLSAIAQLAAAAGHGGKEAVYASACAELGLARATLLRYLRVVTVRAERKQRSDKGTTDLCRKEALTISGVLMDSHRKNRKRLMSVGQAVEALRADGKVRAERIDKGTGELLPLSDAAIARALRGYKLHPDQLLRPEPAVSLRSLHPNHTWQIDASLCVLYYLSNAGRESGLQVMERTKFYKNKPANLKRIENDRVWSYEVTDHHSGAIKVFYVLGAESAANLASSFVKAICKHPDDPIHGVPYQLMMDMGSANTSGAFKNLARRLQVKLLPHAPENARATGQVEKARDIIERQLESGLKFRPVHSLDELNDLARTWYTHFNSTRIHSRHGRTRLQQWLEISEQQLRIAPPEDVCRDLLTATPQPRQVSDQMEVSFNGKKWSVRNVPGVCIGEKLMVAISPYRQDAILVVDADADGNETLHEAPLVEFMADGFRADANVIGEDYHSPAATDLERNRTEVELHTMQAQTLEEAAAKRKAKALPFGGDFNPFKRLEDMPKAIPLPKRGTELAPAVTVAAVAPRLLNHFEAARALVAQGVVLDAARHALIRQWHPDGVPETEIDALATRLTARAALQVIAGGAK